jgi:hypothetical protein
MASVKEGLTAMADNRIYANSLVAALLAIITLSTGCRKVSLDIDCSNDKDCGKNEKCLFGQCVSTADSDNDSGSDGDGDADADCDSAVEGISNWGYECENNSDCSAPGLVCLYLDIEGGAQNKGYCTPVCCDLFENDRNYCTDVAKGVEMCIIFSGEMDNPQKRWCAITCGLENAEDCPDGQVCVGYDNPLNKGICYPSN